MQEARASEVLLALKRILAWPYTGSERMLHLFRHVKQSILFATLLALLLYPNRQKKNLVKLDNISFELFNFPSVPQQEGYFNWKFSSHIIAVGMKIK